MEVVRMEPKIEQRGPIHPIGLETRSISGLAPDADAGDRIGPPWGSFIVRTPLLVVVVQLNGQSRSARNSAGCSTA